jgi:hypothetical protein
MSSLFDEDITDYKLILKNLTTDLQNLMLMLKKIFHRIDIFNIKMKEKTQQFKNIHSSVGTSLQSEGPVVDGDIKNNG